MTTTKKAALTEEEIEQDVDLLEFLELKEVAGRLWEIRDQMVMDGDPEPVISSLVSLSNCSEKIATKAVNAWTEEEIYK
jgi:hypothetical protein